LASQTKGRNRLRAFEKMALRRIFGPKRGTGGVNNSRLDNTAKEVAGAAIKNQCILQIPGIYMVTHYFAFY
jgi:hypothetical protein